jgi:putative methyltransferase (TIGR04325 family)
MRRRVKLFVPPVLWGVGVKIYFRFIKKGLTRTIRGYENPMLVKSVIRKTLTARDEIHSTKKINVDANRVFLPFALSKTEITSVLELGGGAGYHFYNAQAAGLTKGVKWAILETSEMCEQVKKSGELQELLFEDSISKVDQLFAGGIDLVYCSRALQYFPDPLSTLHQVCALKPKFIFITGIAFSPDDKIHETQQKSELSNNGPQVKSRESIRTFVEYDIRYLPETMIEQIISKEYSIELRTNEEPAVHTYRGTEIAYRGIWAVRNDLR